MTLKSKTPEYYSWSNMIQRCTNPKATGYEHYGGRGITVCATWLLFELFLQDMGFRPVGTTLERLDSNNGYFKANCVWANWEQQAKNKRIYRTNKSGIAGVTFREDKNKWEVRHRGVYLGLFETFDEAVRIKQART